MAYESKAVRMIIEKHARLLMLYVNPLIGLELILYMLKSI